MTGNKVLQATSSLRARMGELEQRIAESEIRKDDALTEALQDLQLALEELEVAEEELVEQFQNLLDARAQLEAERRRSSDLLDVSPDGYLETNLDGIIDEANSALAEMLNVSHKYLLGKIIFSFIAEEDRSSARFEVIKFLRANPHHKELNLWLQPHKGIPFHATVRVFVSRDRDGKPLALRWLIRNITEHNRMEDALRQAAEDLELIIEERTRELTEANARLHAEIAERKQVEEFLRVSEQRFRTLADSAPVLIWQTGKDRLCSYINKSWLEFTGLTMKQAIGDGWREAIHPDDLNRCLETYKSAFDARESFSIEYRLRRYDGEYRLLLGTGVPLVSPDEGFKGYIGTSLDITDQMQAKASVREKQNQLAGIIDSAMDAILTVDSDRRIVLFNEAAEKMFRCSSVEAMGKSVDLFIPERFRASYQEKIRIFAESNDTSHLIGLPGDIIARRADGEEFPVEASISQVEAGSQKLFTVILRDITSRIQDEDKLREQAELLDQAPDAIMVRDLEDRILFWNKGAERIYGWTAEEAVGRHVRELHYKEIDDDYYEAKRILLETGSWSDEAHHINRNGAKLVVENRWTLMRDREGNPRSVLVINTDITEKKELEALSLRAQRLENIGTLAAGIAHDLGNILSPILMGVELLRQGFQSPERENFLSIIERNGRRGAELLKHILGFARGVEGDPVVIQPRYLIKEIESVIVETFPRDIELKSYLSEGLRTIRGDATQLHQVLMNLCINARDAMARGGTLAISAENIEIDSVYASIRGRMQTGRYVLIKVSDTGSGISAENMGKIFEPFFTTKEPGKGTGLGLANVAAIIDRHGGFIDVHSKVEGGTEFKIYLPAADEESIQLQEPEQLHLPVGRGEMILVADDEATILEIMRKTLEAYGYRVLTASDGVEAISVYVQNRDEIELILLDMIMPSMDGPAAIRTLKRIDPNVKIVICTAYSESLENVESNQVEAFLSKPFTAQKLLSLLADVLPRSRARGGA
jgi:PAS domain S-box-containing protein